MDSALNDELSRDPFQYHYNIISKADLSYSSCLIPTFIHIRAADQSDNSSNSTNKKLCRLYYACLPVLESVPRRTVLHYSDCILSSNPEDQLTAIPFPLQDIAPTNNVISLAESLLRERMRSAHSGITDLCLDPASGRIVMLVGGELHHFRDTLFNSKGETTTDDPTEAISSSLIQITGALQPTLCPITSDLLAFVSGPDLFVAYLGAAHKLCTPLNLTNLDPNGSISVGSPAFVIQEEFDRYVGFWWKPGLEYSPEGHPVYSILYEETDEAGVELVFLQQHGSWGEVEPHRYPRPGKPNATSTLKLVKFTVKGDGTIMDVHHLKLPHSLLSLSPQMEYIVRVGWLGNSEFIWVQLMNRVQSVLELILIPTCNFFEELQDSPMSLEPAILLLREEDATYWIQTHNCLKFINFACAEGNLEFIWASWRSGFLHLYHFMHTWDSIPAIGTPYGCPPPLRIANVVFSRQLTSGPWEILGDWIYLDKKHKLVIFYGLREHPIWTNIYAVSYATPFSGNIVRLSSDLPADQDGDKGLLPDCCPASHSISAFDPASGLAVIVSSTHTHLSGYRLVRLIYSPLNTAYPDSTVTYGLGYSPSLQTIAWLRKHALLQSALPSALRSLKAPRLLSYSLTDVSHLQEAREEDGVVCYGLLFTPNGPVPTKGFPTLHLVYGGPGIQFVKGACSRSLSLHAQILCHSGYAMLMSDCRGSSNRGSKFAGFIKNRLGCAELDDQVSFLRQAARETGLIDLERVAINGNSYGGYLSLMAAARYKDVYKVAIAGSPVVDWMYYDTAYTERYLGLPSDNPNAYTMGNVMTYLASFPNQSKRLFISHGGQDENVHFSHTSALLQCLTSLGKPYVFMFYPSSRHRIQNEDHLTASIMSFLDQAL